MNPTYIAGSCFEDRIHLREAIASDLSNRLKAFEVRFRSRNHKHHNLTIYLYTNVVFNQFIHGIYMFGYSDLVVR